MNNAGRIYFFLRLLYKKQRGKKPPLSSIKIIILTSIGCCRLVDSIKYIDVENLYKSLMDIYRRFGALQPNGKKMAELVNNDKTVLTISSNYYAPNAFYFPWSVSIEWIHRIHNQYGDQPVHSANISCFFRWPTKRVEVLHTIGEKPLSGSIDCRKARFEKPFVLVAPLIFIFIKSIVW